MAALQMYILRGACNAALLRHHLPTIPPIVLLGALAFTSAAHGQPENKLLAPPPRRTAAPAATTPPPAPLPTLLPTASPPAVRTAAAPAPSLTQDLTPAAPAAPQPGLKIQKGAGILPNEHGQVWREYDISPYTLRVRDVAKPEQAIVDWILRETGTEVWFTEPLGILSASSTLLRVYHTPEMHDRVRGIVERFVGGDVEAHTLGLRLMTVGSPNWRIRALALLKPVDVKSPGVEAWLLSRENAAALGEQLKSRADFREHSAPKVEIANGQSQTLVRTQPRQYVRGVQLKREFPFYDSIPGKLDEGYSLEISPLLTLDRQTMEAAITCSVDQLEKFVPLTMDVPAGGQTQRVQIQVPQMVSWRLAERFRWPASDVLLLSCGVVASPAPGATGILSMLSPLGISGNRADALLMIEHRQPSATANSLPQPSTPAAALPVAKPATPSATIGTPAGSASSVSRGRY